MNGRHILAVAVGVVADFALSLGSGLVLGVAIFISYSVQGVPTNQIITQLDYSHMSRSNSFLLLSLAIGSVAPLISGLLAGWIARTAQVKIGLATGMVSVLLSVPFSFWYPLWYDLGCVIVTIAFPVLGAYVAYVTLGQRAPAALPTA